MTSRREIDGAAQEIQAPKKGAQPYEPAVPSPSVNFYGGAGGYGYGAGRSTAAGSAMNGMANAISAKGNYNLSTSAAAIKYLNRINQIQPDKLFFVHYVPGATHTPHHPTKSRSSTALT